MQLVRRSMQVLELLPGGPGRRVVSAPNLHVLRSTFKMVHTYHLGNGTLLHLTMRRPQNNPAQRERC